MSTTNDGGPAFPCIDTDEPTQASYTSKPGMSLRDWFAGQALAGMIANLGVISYTSSMSSTQREVCDAGNENEVPDMNHIGTALVAYEFADAMLAARGAK